MYMCIYIYFFYYYGIQWLGQNITTQLVISLYINGQIIGRFFNTWCQKSREQNNWNNADN